MNEAPAEFTPPARFSLFGKALEPLRAYQALVTTQQRAGLYALPCAAASCVRQVVQIRDQVIG